MSIEFATIFVFERRGLLGTFFILTIVFSASSFTETNIALKIGATFFLRPISSAGGVNSAFFWRFFVAPRIDTDESENCNR